MAATFGLSGCGSSSKTSEGFGFVENTRPILAPPFNPPVEPTLALAAPSSDGQPTQTATPGATGPPSTGHVPAGPEATVPDISSGPLGQPLVLLQDITPTTGQKSASSKTPSADTTKGKDLDAAKGLDAEKKPSETLSFAAYCPPFRPGRMRAGQAGLGDTDAFLDAPPPNPVAQADFLDSDSETVNTDGSVTRSHTHRDSGPDASDGTSPIWPPNP
jgi:hypothetical protein